MVLDDVITYLAGLGTVGSAGVDLWRGEMPDAPLAPDLSTVLNEYGSVAPDVAFGSAGIYREWPRVQVATRSNIRDYDSGRTRIELIWRALAAMPMPMVLGTQKYYVVRAKQSPYWLKRDDKWRHTFVVNFEFYKEPFA